MNRIVVMVVLTSVVAGLAPAVEPLDAQDLRPDAQVPAWVSRRVYHSPVLRETLLTADPQSDVLIPGLTLKRLEDGSVFVEGVFPSRRGRTSPPALNSFSIMVDLRNDSYRTIRGTLQEGRPDNERIQDYIRSKGFVASRNVAAPSKSAAVTPGWLPDVPKSMPVRRRPSPRHAGLFAFVRYPAAVQALHCNEWASVQVDTHDPPGVLLVRSRSYAFAGEDWDGFGGYQHFEQALNWQDPEIWRTTSLGTTWYRDLNVAYENGFTGVLWADAVQRQYYFNNDFCPFGCGLTWVTHDLEAYADRFSGGSSFSVGTPDQGGTYGALLHHHVYEANGGSCS